MIENLSTEEYSYFLAYGFPSIGEHITNRSEFASLSSLLQTFELDETCDGDDERELPQGIEDVCSPEGYDDIGSVLRDDACTYTQRSTCE